MGDPSTYIPFINKEVHAKWTWTGRGRVKPPTVHTFNKSFISTCPTCPDQLTKYSASRGQQPDSADPANALAIRSVYPILDGALGYDACQQSLALQVFRGVWIQFAPSIVGFTQGLASGFCIRVRSDNAAFRDEAVKTVRPLVVLSRCNRYGPRGI
jgi:hypothetical protein